MEKFYSEQEITVNMKDAGFEEEEIQEFIHLMVSGKKRRAFKILEKQRDRLLAVLHSTQDCIGCLDYLVYRMEEQNRRQQNEKCKIKQWS